MITSPSASEGTNICPLALGLVWDFLAGVLSCQEDALTQHRRPTRDEIAAAYGHTLPDVIGPGLKVLFCGINPSLYSAAIGHHFGRPGNRFWPALHAGGFTLRLLSPHEDSTLTALGLGLTNLVARATAAADELTRDELLAGAIILEQKVQQHRPSHVAFLGVGAYRAAFARPKAALGLQGETLGSAILWVLPNPSGLNAHYQLADLGRLFAELRQTLVTRPRRPRGRKHTA
jgi:double-stranded uracil-DNA glycosylase